MSTKTKVIRGDDLKAFCESYTKPIGSDGKLLKVREFNKVQLSDFRRVCNYNYRLNPEKQALANESARLAHHKRKTVNESYQRDNYLKKIGGTYSRPRMTHNFLDLNALD
mgnify:CR=1 FL=1|tara:strand:- start:262 stop:591 length:330 start_codon:yes stop_codon:yes gene_type:complete